MKKRIRNAVAGVAVLLASCTSHSGSIVPSSVDGVASISTNRVSASARNPQLVWKANGASHAPKAVNVSFERAPAQGTVILVFLKNDGKVGGGANTYTAPAGWTLFDSDTSHARSTY